MDLKPGGLLFAGRLSSLKRTFAFFFLIMLSAHGVRAQDKQVLTADELLRKVETSYKQRPPMAFDSRETSEFRKLGEGTGDPSPLITISSCRQDGGRLDVSRQHVKTKDGKEYATFEARTIWDGEILIHRQKVNKPGQDYSCHFSNKKSEQKISERYVPGSYMDGWLRNGGMEHFSTVMLGYGNSILHSEKEEVDGALCYVVEAKGKYGHYKVWIDDKCGYNIRKAVVRQGPDDILIEGEKTLKEYDKYKYKSIEFQGYDIKLKQIDGIWFPVAGKLKLLEICEGGKYLSTGKISRSNIVWNPDFDKLGAFKMDLPDGTRVRNFDTPGIKYEWKNGKVVQIQDKPKKKNRQILPKKTN